MFLTSLLPAPPDLVLLEYAVNIVERKELEFYDTLLRQFRAAGVPTVAVNADRYDEQGHMRCKCANPAGFSRYEPTGFVREMEQLARQHATPIISLRHAVQPEIGRPGFTSSSRHLVLVKTQLGTVYTHQEFKYEVIDIHSGLASAAFDPLKEACLAARRRGSETPLRCYPQTDGARHLADVRPLQ